MTRPPLIAVTGTTEIVRGQPRVRVNEAYTRAVGLAGMIPVVVPPFGDLVAARTIAGVVDGIVLTGGQDVDPACYGAARHPATETSHESRDRLELALVGVARAQGVPVLAICRGLQVVNVALGGTLVQDIPSELPGSLAHSPGGPRDARVHEVVVEDASSLARALGTTALQVNSSHHQALGRVAAPLRVTARAPDGVIEGAEAIDEEWWMVGVQWHPEELVATPEPWDRALFAALRDAARRRRPTMPPAGRGPVSAGA